MRKILIISVGTDQSTNEVIDWLLSYNCKVIRLNEDDLIELVNYRIDNLTIGTNLNLKKLCDPL